MHLQGYPRYYTKNGKRRAVYYTGEARDLRILGWRPEEENVATSVTRAEVVQGQERNTVKNTGLDDQAVIEAELVESLSQDSKKEQATSLPEFEFMTKTELLQYAMDRGVDLPNNILKAELARACRELSNA